MEKKQKKIYSVDDRIKFLQSEIKTTEAIVNQLKGALIALKEIQKDGLIGKSNKHR